MAGHTDRGGNLFIVDNSDETWKVRRYLHDWCDVAKSMDIATGYFEIGALLELDGQWQKLDKIRILLGDQVTKRTRAVLLAQLQERAGQVLDTSLEDEKLTNDFLHGVAAIEEAMRSVKMESLEKGGVALIRVVEVPSSRPRHRKLAATERSRPQCSGFRPC